MIAQKGSSNQLNYLPLDPVCLLTLKNLDDIDVIEVRFSFEDDDGMESKSKAHLSV